MSDPSSGVLVAPDFVPVVRSDYLCRDVDGQAVVWSPARSSPYALDPAATVMLDVIDGEASISQLADEVRDEVGVPAEIALAQVTRIVQFFDLAGLLTTSSAWGEDARQGINGRQLLDGPLSH